MHRCRIIPHNSPNMNVLVEYMIIVVSLTKRDGGYDDYLKLFTNANEVTSWRKPHFK
jgi:hypothetical protein